MKKFLINNWIVLTIGTALGVSVLMAFFNKSTIEKSTALQQQSELVKELTQEILSETMHGLDIGLRGFSLTKEDNMLIPYKKALEKNASIFNQLDSLLKEQKYYDLTQLYAVRAEVDSYISFCNNIIEIARRDSMNQVISMLREDRGFGVWKKYDDFSKPLFVFEGEIINQAITNYKAAIRNTLILQVGIVLLALPALLLFIVRIGKERKARQRLILEVERNDRKYVFDPGTESTSDATAVTESSIRNVRMASDLIKAMANGDYNVEWTGLDNGISGLNRDTLAGNILDMREKLKKLKLEDEQRNWGNEGLAKFSEVVRNNQGNPQELADRCVSFLAKYLQAQQCGLFVVEGEEADQYLKLSACYAFDRKKWINKRIEIGNGLVGQAFLEGDTIQLKRL